MRAEIRGHKKAASRKDMKVLVISGTFPPMKSGGAEYAFRLCQQLADSKQEVFILTSKITDVVRDPRFETFPVMQRWTWFELPRLLRVVARCRPDVVNIHFAGSIYQNQPMITFLPSILKRRYRNLAVVTHVEYPTGVNLTLVPFATRAVRRGIAQWIGTKDLNWGYGSLLRDSDRVVVLSDQHRHILNDHLSTVGTRCVVIPPPPLMQMCESGDGAARCRGRESLGALFDDFVIAYYGYLYPGKGVETLLEAVSLLKQERQCVRLVLVGGANEVVLREMNRLNYINDLHALTAQFEIANRVTFTGYYPSESDQGSVYLRAADICVLPFHEGVMLNRSSVAAAAAHGLPLITTKGEFLESPFVNGKNVLLCPPQNPTSLAAAIKCAMNDPQLRQQLHFGSLQLARNWFSWENTVERTLEAFADSVAHCR
jgi:glycosyltransferase involved in cell wall biosynthesis